MPPAARAVRAPRPASCRHLLHVPGAAGAPAAGRVEEDVVERRLAVELEPIAQLALELLRRALAHDQPAVDDRKAIAELVGLLQVLGGEEHGRPVAVDALDLLPDR